MVARLLGIREDHPIDVTLVPEWQLSHSLVDAGRLTRNGKAALIQQSES